MDMLDAQISATIINPGFFEITFHIWKTPPNFISLCTAWAMLAGFLGFDSKTREKINYAETEYLHCIIQHKLCNEARTTREPVPMLQELLFSRSQNCSLSPFPVKSKPILTSIVFSFEMRNK